MKGTCFAVAVSRWRFLVKGLKKSPSLSRVSKRGESKFQEWVAVGLLEFRAMGMANASGKPATFAVALFIVIIWPAPGQYLDMVIPGN
jgi:hypothetical protein